MVENATIFIPDISGYTLFLSRTELDHASHIISELLEVIAESNSTNLVLSEVEGDAMLFFRKGEPLPKADMVNQSLDMFRNFHTRVKIIDRDSICQCGACQGACNLTLKFIVHYGGVKELKVAGFHQLSGLNVVVAHRLLKNSIDSDEYILASQGYWDAARGELQSPGLTWQSGCEDCSGVGPVNLRYASLASVRSAMPAPPPRAVLDLSAGGDEIVKDIAAPMDKVYKLLIDLNNRTEWLPGLKDSNSDTSIDRLGAAHRCVFDDFTLEEMPESTDIRDDSIHYVESSLLRESGLKYFNDYLLNRNGTATRLVYKIGAAAEHPLNAEVTAQMMQTMGVVMEAFKRYCEEHPDESAS